MLNLFKRGSGVYLGVLCGVALSSHLRGDTIYDNSANATGGVLILTNSTEVGDEIVLSSTNFSRYLLEFRFEVYGTNTTGAQAFGGSVQADVRFYLNNGPNSGNGPSPGTKFY